MLRLAGAVPVRMHPAGREPRWDRIDGVVLGGGADVDPERYGEAPLPGARLEPERDAMEWEVLAHTMKAGLPLLGICRGAQMMNVQRGGDLHLDLTLVHPAHSPAWTLRATKGVALVAKSAVARATGSTALRVNSMHRQGVARLGDGLVVSARDSLGIVQAIEDPHARFCVGVQWHPELMPWRTSQRALFRSLVEASARSMASERRSPRDAAPNRHRAVISPHLG